MDDSTLQDIQARRGGLATLRAMCSGMTLQGRIALVVIALGFAVLFAVMVLMVMSGLDK
jgi:hypothetical protein